LLPSQSVIHGGRKQANFEAGLERVRRGFGLCVYGYVVMPEHVHLLISEPPRKAPPLRSNP
jgi:REP element-mobilizing transposase RayT